MDVIANLIAQDAAANPPEGFRPIPTLGGYALLFGTVYGRVEGKKLIIGFRCSPRHLNPSGNCHGGVLASFADLQAFGAHHELGYHVSVEPTISLSIEYLAPVKAGDWVEGEATLLRATTRMLFSSMIGRVEGQAVFHTSAIFRLRHRVDENSMARLASLVSSDRSST